MAPETVTPRSRNRRLLARVATCAVLLGVVAACGSDEPPAQAGQEVEGRALDPTTTADATTTTEEPEDSTNSPRSSAPPPVETPTTEGGQPGPLGEVAVSLTRVATAEAPTKLVPRPGTDQLYVSEQGGRILRVDPAVGPDAGPETALDLTDLTDADGERGLLGLAFSPDGETLYVHHSKAGNGETQIASYAMDGDGADSGSRTDLLEVAQPYSNHNGGDILVDDAGLLWIALGDGGAAGDPEDRAQRADILLGKVLRIDPANPSDGRPYGIPADNPFASGGGAPEVVVTGLRNPWRMRFDQGTGDLWIADVGQDELEEIDRIPAASILGANLGWSRFEGSATYDESREIRGTPALGPVFEMSHGDGWCSVSGGPLVRGTAIPDLDGAYLFGDYCKAGLNALRLGEDGQVAETAVLVPDAGPLVSLDTDADGRVYLLSIDGTISRIDPAA